MYKCEIIKVLHTEPRRTYEIHKSQASTIKSLFKKIGENPVGLIWSHLHSKCLKGCAVRLISANKFSDDGVTFHHELFIFKRSNCGWSNLRFERKQVMYLSNLLGFDIEETR